MGRRGGRLQLRLACELSERGSGYNFPSLCPILHLLPGSEGVECRRARGPSGARWNDAEESRSQKRCNKPNFFFFLFNLPTLFQLGPQWITLFADFPPNFPPWNKPRWLLVSAEYARPFWHYSCARRRLLASQWPGSRKAPARPTAASTSSGNGTFWIRITAPSVSAPRRAPRVRAPSARLSRRRASMSATIPPTAAPGARRSAVNTEEWSTSWGRTSR